MNISCTGINSLLNKLNRVSNLDVSPALDMVKNDIIEMIRSACPEDTGKAKQSVGVDDERKYKMSAYMTIGLSNKTGAWDDWKGAYFQNYGYHNWGRGGIYHGTYVFVHGMWFQTVANQIKGSAGKAIKAKLKQLIAQAIG